MQAHLVGIPYRAELEVARTPSHVDHVWLTVEVPPCGEVLISVNTLSRLNLLGGHDPRVRVAILVSRWEERPEPQLEADDGLDYAEMEARMAVDFQLWEHAPLAEMLMAKAQAAVRIEAWGELYRRENLGLHQIHSRRASCAVPVDVIGRDGALRFYLPDGTAEMMLFKYCGQ